MPVGEHAVKSVLGFSLSLSLFLSSLDLQLEKISWCKHIHMIITLIRASATKLQVNESKIVLSVILVLILVASITGIG